MYTLRTGDVPYVPKFSATFAVCSNFILRIKTNSMQQCWFCLATDIWKKSRLNWKLKISNAVDNADITQ